MGLKSWLLLLREYLKVGAGLEERLGFQYLEAPPPFPSLLDNEVRNMLRELLFKPLCEHRVYGHTKHFFTFPSKEGKII